MNQPINFITLLAAIAAAIKLMLQPFGIDLPDDQINSLVNGAASLLVIIGIIRNNFKHKPIAIQQSSSVPQVEYKETSFR